MVALRLTVLIVALHPCLVLSQNSSTATTAGIEALSTPSNRIAPSSIKNGTLDGIFGGITSSILPSPTNSTTTVPGADDTSSAVETLPTITPDVQSGPISHAGKKIHKKSRDGQLLAMKPRYEEYLTLTSSNSGSWDANYIPGDCDYFAKKAGILPENMVVYNVTYSDCPVPWFMCFQKELLDHKGLIETFGRLPVHMRSWVKHLIGFHIKTRERLPKRKRKHQMATQSEGNIVLYGPVKEWLDIMLHQAGHVLDLNGAYGQMLSESEVWGKAIKDDKRVPSNLARDNMYEDVAENTILAV